MAKATATANDIATYRAKGTQPAAFTPYIGLFTDAGLSTEASYTSYARIALAGNMGTAASGTISNTSEIRFAAIDAAEGPITMHGYGIWDAASGGNLKESFALTASRAYDDGEEPYFPVGNLDLTES